MLDPEEQRAGHLGLAFRFSLEWAFNRCIHQFWVLETDRRRNGFESILMHVRVLNWNVFLRPPGVQESGSDHKDVRLELIMRKVVQFDIVLLQEMFAVGSSRLQRLLAFAKEHGLAYHAAPVYPSLWSRQVVDGGVLILSRYPIRLSKTHQFTDGCGSDALAAKGVVYAQIQLGGSPQHVLDVFTTHTQAGDGQVATAVRWRQLEELAWFVHTNRTPCTPAILGGDFNLDARHNVQFAGDAKPIFTKCNESEGYRRLVRLLSSACSGTPDTAAAVANVLASAHDVTNANGHGVLSHLWPKARVDEVGKCIDYLFLLGPSTTSIVHAAIDHGAADDSIVGVHPWPFTHLSDHWAITATLDVPSVDGISDIHFESNPSTWSTSSWPFKWTAVVASASGAIVAITFFLLHLLLRFFGEK
ncbi:hypothetical protein H310_11321 [Aphanomyces invadans]|uniref:sphingomyelin phosphodiesterase n=1 Tax=Aphanomyces invadans TaxID=157072 RepID=A0A024TLY7_9STRA|nr:hypothetical protein H310_11321 [Aphanomyces invadans]ETV94994.1 hypothetical protein H310_11321 [Aphanomyces invadans]|eukprot:XP_008876167.1 hypothetical protein H310_11321 [Aphanomyces invadans]